MNLDVAGGQCVNQSIPQNITFSEQGGVLGNAATGMKPAGMAATLLTIALSIALA